MTNFPSLTNFPNGVTSFDRLVLTEYPPVTMTANKIVQPHETVLVNNKTGSANTVTLPNAALYEGRTLTFVNAQAFAINSVSSNVVQLTGGAASTTILPAIVGSWVDMTSDGTSWRIGRGGTSTMATVSTRTAMAAMPSSGSVLFLTETGREGWFKWDGSNLSTLVTADTQQGIYVPPASATSGTSGAWTRVFDKGIHARWFGAEPVVAGTSLASVPDRTTNLQAALTYAYSIGGATVMLPQGMVASGALTIGDNVKLRGLGMASSTLVPLASLAEALIASSSTAPVSSALRCPGIVVSDMTIDSGLVPNAAWLSRADGTPVTDPQNDYLPGGCLAPATAATLTLTVSGGAVTGVTPVGGGAGYVYPPTVIVSGDGYGAQIDASYAAGAVTGYTIRSGGEGYTAATAIVVGGGANPATALYAADRRNPNYAAAPVVITMTKATGPVIERVRFANHRGIVVNDLGSDALAVRHCRFENGGQSDYVGNCLWSQSHGSISSPPSYFRQSTNTVFEHNVVRNWARSVALLNGINQVARCNDIDGWGESAFFVGDDAVNPRISDNVAANGTLTDITCQFVEGARDIVVDGNTVSGVDGRCVSSYNYGRGRITGNRFTARTSFSRTYPYGPFSERVGYNVGQESIAGTQRGLTFYSAICIFNGSAAAGTAPQSTLIEGNRFVHGSGTFRNAVSFSKGAANSIKNVSIINNDFTEASGLAPFDTVSAATCLDPTSAFIVAGNAGDSSAWLGVKQKTVTANATLDGDYELVKVDATGGNITITLAPATRWSSGFTPLLRIARKDVTDNTVTIARAGSDTINGATSVPLLPYETRTIASDGVSAFTSYVSNLANPDLFRIMAAGGATGGNVTTAQPWFPSNGAVAVEAGTSYWINGFLSINQGASARDFAILFGGTASITSIAFDAMVFSAAPGGTVTAQTTVMNNVATATTLLTASVSLNYNVKVTGYVRINASGTFTPQFQYSADPTGAISIRAATYFRLTKFGTNTVASIGTWS